MISRRKLKKTKLLFTLITSTMEKSKQFASSNSGKKNFFPDLNSWDPTNWTAKNVISSPSSMIVLLAMGIFFGSRTVTNMSDVENGMVLVSPQMKAFIHLISFASWFGTMIYTTFVAGITMFQNLPRQLFGKLQSKLFPIYFMLSSILILLQITTIPSSTLNDEHAFFLISPSILLGCALVMTVLNQFILEPFATSIMFQRHALENDSKQNSDEYKKLSSKFGMYHGFSALLNLGALGCGTLHGYYLSLALV